MPIFAENILHAGGERPGHPACRTAGGALTVSILLSFRPIRRHAGHMMFICVAIFGVATIVFGLSRSLWLSLRRLYPGGGGHGQRGHSLIHAATGNPPSMRGRVSAVNYSALVGASNKLGEYRKRLDRAMDGSGACSRRGRHWFIDGDEPLGGAFPVVA